VAFFLKHAPSQAHVVITNRTEPPLSLASLRANNELLEVDASVLRFDLQETGEFLEHEKPGSLAPVDVKLLHSRTEGWPAQLRIVVSNPSSGQDFRGYVRTSGACSARSMPMWRRCSMVYREIRSCLCFGPLSWIVFPRRCVKPLPDPVLHEHCLHQLRSGSCC
jgi:hypothetical protein